LVEQWRRPVALAAVACFERPRPHRKKWRNREERFDAYESYVDLEPGVWTRYRITVEGTKARLYVHGAAEPCLIVNDLKLGDSTGGVALWIGPGTEGYFTGLQVKAAR
jgi:hypothetical protein